MLLMLMGCDSINSKISKIYPSENLESEVPFIIIPNAGCPGCISSAENLLIKYKGSNCIQFYLTRVVSKKKLKIKLGYDVLEYENIVLDSLDILSEVKVSGFYPVIIYPDNSYYEISPDYPNALTELEGYLEHNCNDIE